MNTLSFSFFSSDTLSNRLVYKDPSSIKFVVTGDLAELQGRDELKQVLTDDQAKERLSQLKARVEAQRDAFKNLVPKVEETRKAISGILGTSSVLDTIEDLRKARKEEENTSHELDPHTKALKELELKQVTLLLNEKGERRTLLEAQLNRLEEELSFLEAGMVLFCKGRDETRTYSVDDKGLLKSIEEGGLSELDSIMGEEDIDEDDDDEEEDVDEVAEILKENLKRNDGTLENYGSFSQLIFTHVTGEKFNDGEGDLSSIMTKVKASFHHEQGTRRQLEMKIADLKAEMDALKTQAHQLKTETQDLSVSGLATSQRLEEFRTSTLRLEEKLQNLGNSLTIFQNLFAEMKTVRGELKKVDGDVQKDLEPYQVLEIKRETLDQLKTDIETMNEKACHSLKAIYQDARKMLKTQLEPIVCSPESGSQDADVKVESFLPDASADGGQEALYAHIDTRIKASFDLSAAQKHPQRAVQTYLGSSQLVYETLLEEIYKSVEAAAQHAEKKLNAQNETRFRASRYSRQLTTPRKWGSKKKKMSHMEYSQKIVLGHTKPFSHWFEQQIRAISAQKEYVFKDETERKTLVSLLGGVESTCFSDTVLPIMEMVLKTDDCELLRQAEQGKKVRVTVERLNHNPVHFDFQGTREKIEGSKKPTETQLVDFRINGKPLSEGALEGNLNLVELLKRLLTSVVEESFERQGWKLSVSLQK